MQSTLSKIILWCIVLVVVGGGLAMWWLYAATPSSSTPLNTNPPSSTTIPPVTGGTQTPSSNSSSTASGIDAAYITLFQTLNARAITFSAAKADSPGALGGVYSLYANDIADSKKLFPTNTDFSIPMSLTDLNQDGTSEVVVYENLPGFCGSGGCSLTVYQVKGAKWVPILDVVGGQKVGISNTITGGYHDLFLSMQGTVGAQTNVVRYVWSGTGYQSQNTVAAWDGSAFTVSP